MAAGAGCCVTFESSGNFDSIFQDKIVYLGDGQAEIHGGYLIE